jgi:formate/nitrite transporter
MSFFQPVEVIPPGVRQAEFRARLPAWNLLLRGALSGAYIGMGACLMIFVTAGIEIPLGAGFTRFIAGSVFPLGIIISVLTGAELFAGDGMLTVMAAFGHKISWFEVFRLWMLVWVGNMAGALFYAALMAFGAYSLVGTAGSTEITSVGVAAVSIAAVKCSSPGFYAGISLFAKAIICGWLVNIAVLLAICADDVIGKILGIWFLMMTMMATGLEHAVTNMALISSGLLAASRLTPLQVAQVGPDIANLGWIEMWTGNLIGASLGNLLGGLLFAVLLYFTVVRKKKYN